MGLETYMHGVHKHVCIISGTKHSPFLTVPVRVLVKETTKAHVG